jgi:hypothetical protein
VIVMLPEAAAATVAALSSEPDSVTAIFRVRDAAQRDHLLALLEYASEGGFAVEIKLLHYRGRPAQVK